MRALRFAMLLAPLALANCGSDRTIVVNPSPQPTASQTIVTPPTQTVVAPLPAQTVITPYAGQMVVMPSGNQIRVCPSGTIC